MNEILLLSNPRKRRGSRKHRTAAQRAATRRMLAVNRARFGHNPAKKRRKSKRKSVAASPIVHRRRSYARKAHRRVSRRGRSFGGSSGVVGMLKTGALMGAGAVVADIGMGLVVKLFPSMPTITTPINADGTTNYTYYAAKGALIYGMHRYGGRVTRYASTMAAGAAAVMLYNLLKGMLPADGSIPLGYFNPGQIAQGGTLGRIMRTPNQPGRNPINQSGMGKIFALPSGANKGAVATATINNVRGLSGLARR